MVFPELADSPRGPRGQSAPSVRTVGPGRCRLPKFFASRVALSLGAFLRLVPRVGRSVDTTRP
jgi:hypothetical protein